MPLDVQDFSACFKTCCRFFSEHAKAVQNYLARAPQQVIMKQFNLEGEKSRVRTSEATLLTIWHATAYQSSLVMNALRIFSTSLQKSVRKFFGPAFHQVLNKGPVFQTEMYENYNVLMITVRGGHTAAGQGIDEGLQPMLGVFHSSA